MPSSISASKAARFALRTLLFAGLVLVLVMAVMHWGPPAAPSDYMSSTVLKNDRLRAIGSPKAVLVGGSNLAFGVDSERLGEALCMPVANMGLSAVLGFRFVADEALAATGEGDLLIVCLERGTYQMPDPMPDALATVVDYRPEAMALVPWRRRPRLVASLGVQHLQSLRDHVEHWVLKGSAPGYNDRLFLPNGDVVSHLDGPQINRPSPQLDVHDTLIIAPEFWPLAHRFVAQAESKGAEVVFGFASMADTIFNPAVNQRLKEELMAHGLAVLGTPERYAFADSLFYDSWYHLRGRGRAMRTQRMIEDLCAMMPERCCAKQ
ncbi:MAG: hypothetical protein WAT74_13075 [Flavobacteriales bacterium]